MVPSENDPVIEEIPGNEVNVATRKINLANALGVGDWERTSWAGDCSIVIDTGFNGCGLRIYHLLRKYVEYLMGFHPRAKPVKTRDAELRFAFGDHQGRMSEASTSLPIWVNGDFRPVRVMLIRGKTELLPGMHLVKKLGALVCFGSDRFKVGKGGWGNDDL